MSQHHVPYTMAALMGAGGVYGYMKSNSKISLAAGLGFAAIYTIAGYL